VSNWPSQLSRALKVKKSAVLGDGDVNVQNDLPPIEEADTSEKIFLPYVGNGFIGVSANSKLGLFANHMKSLSLPVMYNPLVSIYVDNLERKG